MKQRVAVIQGPPGTGKTFIGRMITTTALSAPILTGSFTRPPRILVLCYTNHALDSFLEDLMDAGLDPDTFVRLGRSEKTSDRLKPRMIYNLEQKKSNVLPPNWNRRYGMLKDRMNSEQEVITKVEEELSYSTWGATQHTWEQVRELLDAGDTLQVQHLEELTVPSKVLSDPEGYEKVAKNNRKIREHDLWCRWYNGDKPPEYWERNISESIWDLRKDARHHRIEGACPCLVGERAVLQCARDV